MAVNIKHALAVRSDFSLGESMLQIKHIADRASEYGYDSVALVDTMTISGMPDFSAQMKKVNIKPIIGCRLRVYDDPTYRKPSKASGEKEKPNPFFMPKVFVKDEQGLKSLLKLLSKGNSAEYFYYHARVGMKELLALEGCIVSTGDLYSVFNHAQADDLMDALEGAFGQSGDLFVELVPVNTPLFDTLNDKALIAAEKHGLPTIAAYPTMYSEDKDWDTLEVLGAITTNTQMNSPWRPQQFVHDFCFQPTINLAQKVKAMVGRLDKFYHITPQAKAKVLESLHNLDALVAKCTYEFKKQAPCLPKMADNEFGTLTQLAVKGWQQRFAKPVLGHQPTHLAPYKERLAYELRVLKDMGFAGYFLLVHDLVSWAKSNSIIVGPGRGSVGGSLVAYLLGITEVDPLRFGLIFERFINPERLDLPDADLDFMSTRRHEVLEYLTEKYGQDRVAGISNYSTLASASALRDAGRVHGLDNLKLQATKLVPKEHGASLSLDDAAKVVPELEKFKLENLSLWRHATKLEGAMRSLGQHAAGIVVAGEPIIERAVLETRTGGQVCNWDKRTVEDFGLIKMDILGLSTLDVLDLGRRYVKERHGVDIDYTRLNLEEADVMAAFARGETVGVFQFESSGMRKLIKDLSAKGTISFEDLSAATALYRPGPMDSGLMDDFVKIRQGSKYPTYDHPNVEPALKETAGVMIYQEQVMRVAQDLSGFTMAEADNLRKAIGKKDAEKMRSMKEKFVEGAVSYSGMDRMAAEILWNKIEMFAAYSFNKSHSVEYTVISAWAMWLKVRYPAEFYSAAMTIQMDKSSADSEEKLKALVTDAKKTYDITVLPPDINLSSNRFEILDAKNLLAPFIAVKGISENVGRFIVEGRTAAGGSFKDEIDMLAHINKSKVNIRHRDTLERVGAMVSIKGGVPAKDPSRLKDQMELLPGLIVEVIKANRLVENTQFARVKIVQIVKESRECEGCSLAGSAHPTPRLGSTARFMVVSDAPNWQEEAAGKFFEGDAANTLKAVMKQHGLKVTDAYFTALVKAPKSDKTLTNEQINGCSQYLKREIDALKPPVIVALGSASIRHFLPGIKGGVMDLAGKVVYIPELDASVVCGINPGMVKFDTSKIN